jgi:hypothetical protein
MPRASLEYTEMLRDSLECAFHNVRVGTDMFKRRVQPPSDNAHNYTSIESLYINILRTKLNWF